MKRLRDPAAFRALLEARHLSRRQLGALAACSHTTIQRIMDGQPTRVDLAKRLASNLKQPVDVLFEDSEASSDCQTGPLRVTA